MQADTAEERARKAVADLDNQELASIAGGEVGQYGGFLDDEHRRLMQEAAREELENRQPPQGPQIHQHDGPEDVTVYEPEEPHPSRLRCCATGCSYEPDGSDDLKQHLRKKHPQIGWALGVI